MEIDSSYVANPDFKELFEPAVVNVEHQSTPVTLDKIKAISQYKIQQTVNEHLPPCLL